jgi:thiazole synthase
MDVFKIGNRIFKSRLIVGTGKYKDLQETADAVKVSGADLVTVAVRRVNIIDTKEPLLMDYIDPEKITYLPNTAGCFTSEDALRTLRLAKESGGWNLVKLEVLGDEKTLYPNMQETIKAAKILVEEGFEVMVYCSDDPIACKILEKIGVVAVMPLGSLIGSGQGIPNKLNIEIIKKQSNIPVIVDAGIGTASDAVIAMELGCDAVLVNSAIAKAKKPLMMAESMKNAVIAGRQSYLSGRMDKINIASASSPINGKINN